MQQAHNAAIQRQHEGTIRELLAEHGVTGAAAEAEIQKWRASGGADHLQKMTEEPAPSHQGLRARRGENGQILQQQSASDDPFKKRTVNRSSTPLKAKPFEVDDPFKSGPRAPGGQRHGTPAKPKPFEVDDPFKSGAARRGASPRGGRSGGTPRAKKEAWAVEDPFAEPAAPDASAITTCRTIALRAPLAVAPSRRAPIVG